MPELPEVETIKRIIEPQLQGRLIEEVLVRRPEVIDRPEADEFCRRLTGRTFLGMTRRGKYLIFMLDDGEPCPVCGEVLRRIVIGGRGAVFCPACQEDASC